ncbi:MAG: nicotinate (nicotinamide) nucleotide adenylyltransferase [Treponema sp.]|jgi:nicotinate-nucleotide adenylyltransferase|nr:nicotinate (nicotinamide) nucleotide adenylyltransferase [Treponema sp.]
MKLAILGSSFNPIHLGHLMAVDEALTELHYDRVVMVPAYRSPFKLAALGMEDSAHARLEMAAASIAGDPRLTVDDCEIRRGGVSYTADTVADIIRRYAPEGKPGLIIGDDLAADFPQWHRNADILAMADIIIVRRGHSGKLNVPYPCTQLSNDAIKISSAMVRDKIMTNTAWHYLVPAAARTIIEERGLYGLSPRSVPASPASPSKSLILRVEESARESLNLERFLHSRNTALFAWDMCKRLSSYNLDPELGYLAGIAHDLGKRLGDKELLRLAKSDGRGISRLEKEKPSLLHGRASAVLLKERFNVNNEAALEAAALHTEGGKNMGPLAKVVYIADKTEVSREKLSPEIRKLAYTEENLDRILIKVLEQTMSWLRARKLKPSEDTVNLLEKMRRACK